MDKCKLSIKNRTNDKAGNRTTLKRTIEIRKLLVL